MPSSETYAEERLLGWLIFLDFKGCSVFITVLVLLDMVKKVDHFENRTDMQGRNVILVTWRCSWGLLK